jgi:hypothetical protein
MLLNVCGRVSKAPTVTTAVASIFVTCLPPQRWNSCHKARLGFVQLEEVKLGCDSLYFLSSGQKLTKIDKIGEKFRLNNTVTDSVDMDKEWTN